MSRTLLTEEKTVLKLVQEYIKENRYFKADEIVSYINSRFAKGSTNINDVGIKNILQSLVKKNLIVDGSKLTREDVLLNENRRKIYEYISLNPGTYFSKIFKELNLNIPVVGWHINILNKFGYIRKKKISNHEVYFASSENQDLDEAIHLVGKEKGQKIVEYFLQYNEGVTQTQLCRKLGMHSNTITKYVRKLEKSGLLIKKKLSNKKLYFLDEELWFAKFN